MNRISERILHYEQCSDDDDNLRQLTANINTNSDKQVKKLAAILR